jgi:hypothetical protein
MDELHGMHPGGEGGGVPGLLVDDGGAVLVESRDLDAIHFDFHAAAVGRGGVLEEAGRRQASAKGQAKYLRAFPDKATGLYPKSFDKRCLHPFLLLRTEGEWACLLQHQI